MELCLLHNVNSDDDDETIGLHAVNSASQRFFYGHNALWVEK